MIENKEDLKRIINTEKKYYYSSYFEKKITYDQSLVAFKYQKLLRIMEFHHNLKHKLRYMFYRRLKNKLGVKIGVEIWDNSFDEGLIIYHIGNIVVNGNSKIGKNCKLHGSNCIGNNGKNEACPVIGDNVTIGVGAKIIGGVTIANNIIIGAGAVVVDSFDEEGITICGIPARKI